MEGRKSQMRVFDVSETEQRVIERCAVGLLGRCDPGVACANGHDPTRLDGGYCMRFNFMVLFAVLFLLRSIEVLLLAT
jgi:hypothetical protein